MDFFQTVRDRRSIRKYQSTPVEPEKIAQILEAARLAPSWKNKQCWRFLVLTGRDRIAGLVDALPADNPARKAFSQAPAAIVVSAARRNRELNRVKIITWQTRLLPSSIFAWRPVLWAWEPAGWVFFDETVLKEFLGIPAGFRVVGVTPLGYPAQAPEPRPRKALSEIAYLDEWGVPYGN